MTKAKAKDELPQVKARRDISGSLVGSRSRNEKFGYDVDGDPAGLIARGWVEPVDKPASAPGGGDTA